MKNFTIKANLHGKIEIAEPKEKAIKIFEETKYGLSDITKTDILPSSTNNSTTFEIHSTIKGSIEAENLTDAIKNICAGTIKFDKLNPDIEIAEINILEIRQEDEKDKEDVWKNICTDKKHNIRYWDDIDNIAESFIQNLINMSKSKNFTADSSTDDIDEEILETYKSVLDTAISELENKGYEFPYINENY